MNIGTEFHGDNLLINFYDSGPKCCCNIRTEVPVDSKSFLTSYHWDIYLKYSKMKHKHSCCVISLYQVTSRE